MTGNKIFIDGEDATPDAKVITVKVEGNVDSIDIDCCDSFTMTGDAGKIKSTNGNIDISGNVSGDVETTNGNVSCGSVGGSVKTKNGNIKHR